MRLLWVGKIGREKSTTGSTFLGQNVFHTAADSNSVTGECVRRVVQLGDTRFEVGVEYSGCMLLSSASERDWSACEKYCGTCGECTGIRFRSSNFDLSIFVCCFFVFRICMCLIDIILFRQYHCFEQYHTIVYLQDNFSALLSPSEVLNWKYHGGMHCFLRLALKFLALSAACPFYHLKQVTLP